MGEASGVGDRGRWAVGGGRRAAGGGRRALGWRGVAGLSEPGYNGGGAGRRWRGGGTKGLVLRRGYFGVNKKPRWRAMKSLLISLLFTLTH